MVNKIAKPSAPPSSRRACPNLAYEHLREAIFAGTLAAGSPLRQEEIAARLGVSRLPVREALRRLESEGLVVLRPRRGYVVASLDREEIKDVLDLQATLEALAGHSATLAEATQCSTNSKLPGAAGVTSRTPVNIDAFAD